MRGGRGGGNWKGPTITNRVVNWQRRRRRRHWHTHDCMQESLLANGHT